MSNWVSSLQVIGIRMKPQCCIEGFDSLMKRKLRMIIVAQCEFIARPLSPPEDGFGYIVLYL